VWVRLAHRGSWSCGCVVALYILCASSDLPIVCMASPNAVLSANTSLCNALFSFVSLGGVGIMRAARPVRVELGLGLGYC